MDNFPTNGDDIESALMDLDPSFLGVTIKEEATDDLAAAAAPNNVSLNTLLTIEPCHSH